MLRLNIWLFTFNAAPYGFKFFSTFYGEETNEQKNHETFPKSSFFMIFKTDFFYLLWLQIMNESPKKSSSCPCQFNVAAICDCDCHFHLRWSHYYIRYTWGYSHCVFKSCLATHLAADAKFGKVFWMKEMAMMEIELVFCVCEKY